MTKQTPLQIALKNFMKENFCYSTLKKVGFYSKEIKFNDYEAQAKRMCKFLGLESIYDYGKHQIRCHLSTGHKPLTVNEDGELKREPFVTTIFPNQLGI